MCLHEYSTRFQDDIGLKHTIADLSEPNHRWEMGRPCSIFRSQIKGGRRPKGQDIGHRGRAKGSLDHLPRPASPDVLASLTSDSPRTSQGPAPVAGVCTAHAEEDARLDAEVQETLAHSQSHL